VTCDDNPFNHPPHKLSDTLDVAANTGFVNVGTDRNTAALAVESIRRWWQMIGANAYPGASRLLITCDAGGSNGWKNRAWKAGLAGLAEQTGLEITVCHFPPGTSKWNKVEHRLFSQITLAWRGRPLTSYDVIISTIGAVTTRTGLAVTAALDENPCPAGTRISDERMKDIDNRCLTRHGFRSEWNYALAPVPRPAPPEPEPARPARPDRDALNHPALTGIDPASLTAAAAAIELPPRIAAEKIRYQRTGRPRQKAPGSGGHNRQLSPADHILIARLRAHLGLSLAVIAGLFGLSRSTISHASALATRHLAARPALPAAPPPATRPRTLDDLLAYAASHGITITPPGTADTTPDTTLTTPDTPQTHINLE
jgi:Rhodopirellula transposase DDE domain